MAITRLNTNALGTSVNLASNVTGTLPAANRDRDWETICA